MPGGQDQPQFPKSCWVSPLKAVMREAPGPGWHEPGRTLRGKGRGLGGWLGRLGSLNPELATGEGWGVLLGAPPQGVVGLALPSGDRRSRNS